MKDDNNSPLGAQHDSVIRRRRFLKTSGGASAASVLAWHGLQQQAFANSPGSSCDEISLADLAQGVRDSIASFDPNEAFEDWLENTLGLGNPPVPPEDANFLGGGNFGDSVAGMKDLLGHMAGELGDQIFDDQKDYFRNWAANKAQKWGNWNDEEWGGIETGLGILGGAAKFLWDVTQDGETDIPLELSYEFGQGEDWSLKLKLHSLEIDWDVEPDEEPWFELLGLGFKGKFSLEFRYCF